MSGHYVAPRRARSCVLAGVRLQVRVGTVATLMLLAACTTGDDDRAGPTVVLAEVTEPVAVVRGPDAATLALATSRAVFARTPVVVVAPAGSAEDVQAAAARATELGVPTLLLGDAEATRAELERLGARSALVVGDLDEADRDVLEDTVDLETDADGLPAVEPATAGRGVVGVVSPEDVGATAARSTLEAARIEIVELEGADPRLPTAGAAALREPAATHVVAVGTARTFPDPITFAGLLATARAGTQLPGEGQVLFPGRRLVALYGHPGDPNLGVLGEQGPAESVGRAAALAATYDGLDGVPAVPAFEIITTVASSEAGPDGDYSLTSSLDHIRPWVDAAAASGTYVVLDLQPGHTDFLTQAKLYEELLVQPHVGLALDPEWRLAPGERHLVDIGQVSADEVNEVVAWLAWVTRANALPQKLLLLHQFRTDMLPDRARIHTPPELALVVQMDGLGSQEMKLATWSELIAVGPPGVRFGWKQFYDEDTTLRSPADTVALTPSPVLVSYQ